MGNDTHSIVAKGEGRRSTAKGTNSKDNWVSSWLEAIWGLSGDIFAHQSERK